jgi:hypothetical protein
VTVAAAPPIRRYRPQLAQESWHACPAYESGFGGAKFGGKTLALLMESARHIGHPRYRGILFRRTYPRLQEVLDRAWEWFPGMGGTWRGDEHRWLFPSGASIAMRHCQHEESKFDYQGHEYQFMGFDQLEEFSETQYAFLLAQNRSGVADLQPYVRVSFNPGGIGHAWVKARFVDRGTVACLPWVETNEAGDALPPRCFHFAGIDDNPLGVAADPTYKARLDNLPENERRALKGGDWDVFAGQYFFEWRRERHVIEPIALDPSWPRWRALDDGIARPFVCLWLCQDPATLRTYVYREVSQSGVPAARDRAALVHQRSAEPVRFTVADPSMWTREKDTGKSVAQTFKENGLVLRPGSNSRISGWQRVHEMLADAEDGRPYLQVFSSCRQLVKNLPALVYDRHVVEDLDSDGPDDESDALRYGLMAAHWTVRVKLPGPIPLREMAGVPASNPRDWAAQFLGPREPRVVK